MLLDIFQEGEGVYLIAKMMRNFFLLWLGYFPRTNVEKDQNPLLTTLVGKIKDIKSSSMESTNVVGGGESRQFLKRKETTIFSLDGFPK